MKNYFKKLLNYFVEFFARYPAILSGFIIYCYLSIAIVRLFYKVKFGHATLSDAYDIFSALPFMWFLAVSLVKVIEFRTKLHESETQQLARGRELQLKEAQLTTMHEVVKGLQHQINNPLAIIALLITKAKKSIKENHEAIGAIESIEHSANKIAKALEDFARAQQYEVNHIGPLEGKITTIPQSRSTGDTTEK